MILRAYFDDSGNSPDQDVLALGGLISTDEQWSALSDQWSVLLERQPTTSHVKYREILRGRGAFDPRHGWSEQERFTLLADLSKLIAENCMAQFYVAMHHFHFEKHIRDVEFGIRTLMNDHPYVTLMNRAPIQVARYLAKQQISEPCNFYFDTSQGAEQFVREMWPEIQNASNILRDKGMAAPPTIGDLQFGSELECIPLQAADIIAGVWRDRVLGVAIHPSLALIEQLPAFGHVFDEKFAEERGRSLRRSAQKFRIKYGNTKLYPFNPETAARTRKLHDRMRKKAPKGSGEE